MLATPTPTPGLPPNGPQWVHEVKWDGIRALAEIRDGRLTLYSRNGNDITLAYPEIVAGAAGLPDSLLLDGEIIVLDPTSGIPTLQALAPRIHVRDPGRAARLAGERPATYMVFDLLRAGHTDLTRLPLEERKKLLEQLDLPRLGWRVSETYDDAETITSFTLTQGLEGVISKRRGSPYQPGTRSSDWIKTPHRAELVAVIGGWVPEHDDDRRLGSVWIGHAADESTFHQHPVLYPLGRVGSGLPLANRDALLTVLRETQREECPFDPAPEGPEVARTHWVEPILCVQVRYLTVSASGLLRQPVMQVLRPDVAPVAAATAALVDNDTRLLQ